MIPKEVLKKVRHIEIRTRHMVNDLFAGQYNSAFKGQGMEFQEVRQYVPGDDVRDIDWNVTARTNEPFIKKFREERELTVLLVVDISASHHFGSQAQLKKDLVAEITAVLAFSAIKNSDRVGLILHSDHVEHYIPPQKGPRHVLRVIRDVLNFEPHSKKTLITPVLTFINRLSIHKSVLFMIGDFMIDEEFKKELTVTSRKHDVIAAIIGDRREAAWPKAGLIEWQDAENGHRQLVDLSNRATRLALSQKSMAHREKLLKVLRYAGVDPIQVYAGQNYEKEFIGFFKKRARRS